MEEVPVPIILSIFSGIELHLFNVEVLISFSIVVLLIMCSAFISGAEVAYFSLSASELDDLAKEKKSSVILKLLKKPNQLLATILIANNFINVAIIILAAYLTSLAISFPEGSSLEFIFQVVIITLFLVLFGEITPKVYANQNAKQFSLNMAKPLIFLTKVFYPLSYLLVTTTNFKIYSIKNTKLELNSIIFHINIPRNLFKVSKLEQITANIITTVINNEYILLKLVLDSKINSYNSILFF